MLSVEAAARLLDLNPQTVYRKIKRGEIKCVRIGKTIRIKTEELTQPCDSRKPIPLPASLRNLFWDADATSLTSHDDLVMERVLDQGDLGSVHWLLDNCDRSRIIQYLLSKGKRRISKKSFKFWSAYFGQNSSIDSEPGAKEALGQTHWR